MGTRVTGSTTSSTTTSPATSRTTTSPSPDRFTSTASQGLPDSWPLVRVLLGKTDAAYLSDRRLPFLKATNYLESTLGHTFWALAWGRKSVKRGRGGRRLCCVILRHRQMWNSGEMPCNRISRSLQCNALAFKVDSSRVVSCVNSQSGNQLSPPAGNCLIK